MSTFRDLVQQDRRLVILRFLQEEDYTLNTSVLQTALHSVGHNCSRDCVEIDCAWLAEQGLVAVEQVGPVNVVRLTSRGVDVANGHAQIPGVARPRPRG